MNLQKRTKGDSVNNPIQIRSVFWDDHKRRNMARSVALREENENYPESYFEILTIDEETGKRYFPHIYKIKGDELRTIKNILIPANRTLCKEIKVERLNDLIAKERNL